MHKSVMDFGKRIITEDLIKDKIVLELGSRNINGTLSTHCKQFKPLSFTGIDYVQGDNVDKVLDLVELKKEYSDNSVDFILSTELMEHVEDWITVVNNMKDIVKVNGYIFLTTRGKGMIKHGYPYDYWRYEIEDIKDIFSDMDIIVLERDTELPGILLLVKKNSNNKKDINNIKLYNINTDKRQLCTPKVQTEPGV